MSGTGSGKRGPKPLAVNGEDVEKLAGRGLNQEEIGTILGCSADTLQRRFSREMQRGWQRMRASVKRAQFDLGVNKLNPTMLIWLGKQHLGQSDPDRHPPKTEGTSDQLKGLFDALMSGPATPKKAVEAEKRFGADGGTEGPKEGSGGQQEGAA